MVVATINERTGANAAPTAPNSRPTGPPAVVVSVPDPSGVTTHTSVTSFMLNEGAIARVTAKVKGTVRVVNTRGMATVPLTVRVAEPGAKLMLGGGAVIVMEGLVESTVPTAGRAALRVATVMAGGRGGTRNGLCPSGACAWCAGMCV